ncbi:hypothetical protein J2X20_000613 [Pelomonas saccharophila]|uniref:Excalibur calcium-binding domain-containing protein n=1 Tax=Roseateles saccharophilus TaxID=304 RepID=A0ABU1YGJ5_ROSSA|nr:hypothetical protein [Roseateles saccharophilus]MDR7267984.1 hypothetical protein [Roseateles saccharophilus]
MAGFTTARLCVALILVCVCAAPSLAAAKPQAMGAKARNDSKPLRFDPPAAGPTQPGNAGYDACVDQPSPDGATIDCQALQRTAVAAKPKPRRR